ncbi:hypothetical protein T310_8795, partial [Rasamsonia emersonii CBS 393.64]
SHHAVWDHQNGVLGSRCFVCTVQRTDGRGTSLVGNCRPQHGGDRGLVAQEPSARSPTKPSRDYGLDCHYWTGRSGRLLVAVGRVCRCLYSTAPSVGGRPCSAVLGGICQSRRRLPLAFQTTSGVRDLQILHLARDLLIDRDDGASRVDTPTRDLHGPPFLRPSLVLVVRTKSIAKFSGRAADRIQGVV